MKQTETKQQKALKIPDDQCLGYSCNVNEPESEDYDTIPEIYY